MTPRQAIETALDDALVAGNLDEQEIAAMRDAFELLETLPATFDVESDPAKYA